MSEERGSERARGGLPLEQAEALVERGLVRVRLFAMRLTALAREEAEDTWAEAKTLRRESEPTGGAKSYGEGSDQPRDEWVPGNEWPGR